ncbi:MAG: cupin domain-containing protein [Gammaproteobacteria bacterium]|jgi:cupin 2 domain-containing protein|nr:cupin domain-containing protein [Gammaproteobacteria bacterium]
MNNIFDAIPKNLETESFQRLVKSDTVKIERIISRGHSSPDSGWYDQNENEWVMLVQGEATLAFADAASITLRTGDFVNIPAHTKHRVDWTTPEIETIWLAVYY